MPVVLAKTVPAEITNGLEIDVPILPDPKPKLTVEAVIEPSEPFVILPLPDANRLISPGLEELPATKVELLIIDPAVELVIANSKVPALPTLP